MKKDNKRFYFRIDSERNESVEIYVGQNAGRQLNQDILNAKEEVLIISPYIDEAKVDDLINLKNRKINIRLAFSDLRESQYHNILRKLIHQHRTTDVETKEKCRKQKDLFLIIAIAAMSLGIFLLLFFILNFNDKINLTRNYIILFLSLVSFVVFYLGWKKKKKIEKTEIYSYQYAENLNFKFIRNNNLEKFIHSKIYIIDRKVAYLGSLNYTNNGFTKNFETRIRISQADKISELVDFVHELFDDNYNFQKHELFYLGQRVYSEEKY